MTNRTEVVVMGLREGAYIINSVVDTTTGATDGTAMAGRCLTLMGKNIKVEGDAQEVGITLTNEDTGEVVRINTDTDLVSNTRTKVTIQLPSDIAEAQYKLTIRAQNATAKDVFSKTVHEASTSIYVIPKV